MNERRRPVGWAALGVAGVLTISLVAVAGGAAVAQDTGAEPQKVILDTDMVELFDDGMAMLMLDRAEDIDLLGVTIVSGNTPMPRGMATGARQLEALGSDTPIYAGSRYGIRNWRFDETALAAEQALSPVVSWPGYLGHYDDTIGGDPMADWVEVYESLYGEAPTYEYVFEEGTPDADGNDEAIGFLVDQVNKYPGEVTVVAIGPLTNIARAIMKDPTFPSKVKEMVYMGGSFYLPGNSSASAEFNWWADPEAAKVAVRQQWGDPESESYASYGNQVIAGLEANANTGAMPEDLYREMVDGTYPGIQELFLAREEAREAQGRPITIGNIWDLFAAAYVIDPSIVLSWNDDPRPEGDVPQPIYGVYVDVDTNDGLDYGRSLAFREDVGPVGTQKAAIENFIDEEKFWTELVVPLSKDPQQ
ncbi:MAG: nucleoside hydrolase [Chloroflexota bacterium]|jgi:inosine-uridine nucleoside N-ribohydrolase